VIDRFTRSLAVDSRLVREDIEGSRAYAKALLAAGVLQADEQRRLDQALGADRHRARGRIVAPARGGRRPHGGRSPTD